MNKLNALLFSYLLLVSTTCASQNFIVENANIRQGDNVGVITHNENVHGYFIFYRIKKQDNYVLHILDSDLNIVSNDTIKASLYINFYESIYNGENMVFKLYNNRTKIMDYLIYDNKGQFIRKKSMPISKGFYRKDKLVINIHSKSNASFFATENGGLVSYNKTFNKKQGYSIHYFSTNDIENLTWEFSSDEKSKKYLEANYLHNNKNALYSLISETKNSKGKELVYYIQSLDINTGEEIFKIDLSKLENRIIIADTYFDEEKNNIVLFGEYIDSFGTFQEYPSKGLIRLIFDLDGNKVDSQKIPWNKVANRFAGEVLEQEIKVGSFSYLHEFFKLSNGNIYAIGEEFGIGYEAGGGARDMALSLALPGIWYTQKSKLISDDIFVYHFNDKFELLNVKIIEKSQRVVSPSKKKKTSRQWANDVYYKGDFDYAFTTINKVAGSFGINYKDHQASNKDIEGNILLKSYYFKDDVVKFNKVLLSPKLPKPQYQIFPAKDGYFMFSKYIKNSGKIVNKLQKIDFEKTD